VTCDAGHERSSSQTISHVSIDFVVEGSSSIGYIKLMSQVLEQRVEALEKKVAELSAQILGLRSPKKDWRRTVGAFPSDELTKEAERFGREYRQQQTYEQEIAGS
jgi:hypothetical protein